MPDESPRMFSILGHDGKAYGPVPLETIRRWMTEGRVVAATPVQAAGDPQFRPAAQVPELMPLFGVAPGELPEAQDIPWERREALGFFPALWATIKGVMTSPAQTFRGMNVSRGYGPPMMFAFMMMMVCGMVGALYSYGQGQLMQAWMGKLIGQQFMRSQFSPALSLGVSVAFLPFGALVAPFVSAGLYHLVLMVCGGAQSGYEATYRVVCYTTGACAVILAIPFCGQYTSGIWALVCTVVGLREVHRTTTAKAVAAVLVPIVVFCGLLVGLVVVLIAAGAAAGLMR